MAEAVVHQSQQRDAEEDTRRELEPGAAAANGQPPDHAAEDTGKDLQGTIALRRLLAVATLTPAQAGLLAVDLMDTLVTLEERGECPDQVNDRSVLVRRDGTVVVAPSLEAAIGTASSASTATTDAAGANDTASGTASDSEEDSGGDDTGEAAAGGSASTKASSNGGKGRTKKSTGARGTGSRSRSGTKSGGTTARRRNGSANGSARAAERGLERLPVAATTANSLVRLLAAHTRGGSARRKVDAALLTDRLTGTSTDLSELRDKVRGAVNELAAGDGASWQDWTTTTRRQIIALVTATEGRKALRDTTPVSGSAQHGSGAADNADGADGGHEGSEGDSETTTDAAETSSAATSSSSFSLARGDLRGARRRAWYRKRRLPRRKAVVITLIVAMVAVAGWWAVPRAWSELRRGWEAVFTTSQPSQQLPPVAPPEDESSGGKTTGKSDSTAAADKKTNKDDDKPGPVPRLAPKEAGPINGVTIERAEGECTRGEVCPVRVDVRLDPSASHREISWSLRIVDRCTDKIRKREGVTMAAAPGWQQVYGISRPTLPDSRSLAVVAVTDTPAKAASAPLLVSANRALC
ncbi:hypothetical protein [Haloechinothrix halophila]|uniref:hypothetical protein n=1 Tax=Haloechinothrix halophila TaxID=1069073 RepID=UPI00040AF51C|nr:hypothetical protein [Haloechinothrix halophila]